MVYENMRRLFFVACGILCIEFCALGNAKEFFPACFTLHKGAELPGTYLYYWIDSAGTASIETAESALKSGLFVRNHTSVFSQAPTAYDYWFYFIIDNKVEEPLWLEAGSLFTWEIDVYGTADGGPFILLAKGGASIPDSRARFGHHEYWLPLSDSVILGKQAFLVHLRSMGPVELPLTLGSLADLFRLKSANDAMVAAFIAVALLVIMYNGVLLVYFKDSMYAYYIFYLVTISPAVLFGNGFPLFEYLFGVSTFWGLYIFVWFFPAFLSIGLFTSKYLDLFHRAPVLFRLVWFGVFLLGLLAVLNVFYQPVSLSILYALGLGWLLLSCLLSGIYMYYIGYHQARLYVLGWSMLFLSLGIYMFTLYGFLPYNVLTRNITYFSVSLEFILFSLALADRMQFIRRQNEQIQLELLQKTQEHTTLLNAYNEELKTEVERTTLTLHEKARSLEAANQEITSMNEELTSLVDELQQVLNTVHEQNETIRCQSEEIYAINAGLEAAILEKTRLLTEQNERLRSYAYINSHKVRAPVARILGLSTLIKAETDKSLTVEYHHLLSESAKELDKIIREMNTILVDAGYYSEPD
jgi:hypothetical protein